MDLSNVSRKKDFYLHTGPKWVRVIWPRLESLEFFIKHNKETLLAQGGIVRIGRDYFVVIDRFEIVARDILGVPANKEAA